MQLYPKHLHVLAEEGGNGVKKSRQFSRPPPTDIWRRTNHTHYFSSWMKHAYWEAASDNLGASEIQIRMMERRRSAGIGLQGSNLEVRNDKKQSFILFTKVSWNKHLLTCAAHCCCVDVISQATQCLLCDLWSCSVCFVIAVLCSEQILHNSTPWG